MPFIRPTVGVAAGLAALFLTTACSPSAAADLAVGDCLKIGGPPDRPETTKVECGSPESNFKVVATVDDGEQCPSDADSYYSMRSAFSDATPTVCMDVDWVIGDCMSLDPDHDRDPVRADCADSSVPHRQRVTQILDDVASVDQCRSGLGYAYEERQFTVCVEDVS